jgi:hypothetical protein
MVGDCIGSSHPNGVLSGMLDDVLERFSERRDAERLPGDEGV